LNRVGGFLLLAAIVFAAPTQAADLTVEVRGLKSSEGQVHLGLYDSPETFPGYDGRLDGADAAITDQRADTVFKGLKPGFYAVAVYHDENANGEFDQFIFGLPLEDFGFSNNALAFFGPPSFDSAKVKVPVEGVSITINID